MKTKKGMYQYDIKQERLSKLTTITNSETIRQELTTRKLKFTEQAELFTVVTKNKEFYIQIDGDSIMCWINVSKYNKFNLCQYGLDIEEFVMELDVIIEDIDKFYKLKTKIDKKIDEIENLINSSEIYGLELNDGEIDYLLFENLIYCDEN